MTVYDYTVLILASEDHGYERPILYPSEWSIFEAEQKALAVMQAAQNADPDEWSWDDYEAGFLKAGFVIPIWFHGPTWDVCHTTTEFCRDPRHDKPCPLPCAACADECEPKGGQ